MIQEIWKNLLNGKSRTVALLESSGVRRLTFLAATTDKPKTVDDRVKKTRGAR